MNAADAGRRHVLSGAEVRRLIRDGYLPYSVRGGRFFLEERDLIELAEALPDRYQVVRARVGEFIESVQNKIVMNWRRESSRFIRPLIRSASDSIYQAERRGLATAARNAAEAVSLALDEDCRENVSKELAVVGMLSVLLDSART